MRNLIVFILSCGSLLVWAFVSANSSAAESSAQETKQAPVQTEKCASYSPLRQPYFGDLHVHTALSLDASTMGTINRPADAYRFARGQRLGLQPYRDDGSSMREIELARPLDFAAVTDRAELLGETHICNQPGLEGHDSWVCRVYRSWPRVAFFFMNLQASRGTRHDFCGENGQLCLEAARKPWQETQQAANAAQDRSSDCEFTAFTGYEWTGASGLGNNLHRNVIFKSEAVPDLPASFIDAPRLEDFWRKLEEECLEAKPGCDVLVIPHNSNLGGGQMFRSTRRDGEPILPSQARKRARFEVLVEVMQHKGDSECFPGLETNDELCAFEKLPGSNFASRFVSFLEEPPTAHQFIRNVLKAGLEEKKRMGVNPFEFGFIASTDTHMAIPGSVAESADYPGHGGAGKPPGEGIPTGLQDSIDFNPGGLAVLWAEENSRESLFAAMKRKETYGTSGPRIVLRFFGGWQLPESLCQTQDVATAGYTMGVPMGSALPNPIPLPKESQQPGFVVSALADPGTTASPGVPLQRIQIIKGWLGADGRQEVVYDVAGNPNNGSDVDLETCEPRGSGSAMLCTVWQDPDFDPEAEAFYYARVLENPSCRWSHRACLAAGVRCDEPESIAEGYEACCSETIPKVVQERAWSSPIWYRAQKQ